MGLIPAHAGKTMTAIDARACSGAHPRSRGENSNEPPSFSRSPGSSPLTRGKLTGSTPTDPITGLIPAHAGKTRVRFTVELTQRAHPRSRGENPPR